MGWRRGEPLSEDYDLELCVHGHFFLEEGNKNGIFGAWWAPVAVLVEKAGAAAMQQLFDDFMEELKTEFAELMQMYSQDSAQIEGGGE